MLGYVEAELEEPMEHAQVDAITNLALDQGKPKCITLQSLTLLLN
jgi:hypothetical protein